ncbi:MAG: CinA family nicotinamide mononucleotide deamidase-related protein, partial [Nitrospirota bacterium]
DPLARAIARSEVVITTGGLGATEDDLTKKVLAKVTRRRLVLNEELRVRIRARWRRRNEPMPPTVDRQAFILSRAQLIENRLGTAPGIQVTGQGYWLASLPGVPHEMEAMFDDVVSGLLQARFGLRPLSRLRVLRCSGISESAVNERLRPLFASKGGRIGLIAKPSGIEVWLLAPPAPPGKAAAAAQSSQLDELARLEQEARARLGDVVFGADEETLEAAVGQLLRERNLTLAVAESCTGGLIAHLLTNVPGSSAYVERGAVCYSNAAKSAMAGVEPKMIEEYGAVSAQVAWALADGIRRTSGASLGVGVTGIAGPTGGSADKPVGLVHVAVADSATATTKFYHFHGDRAALKQLFAQAALDLLRRHLLKTA